MQKFGQTFGVLIFTMTTFGKDPAVDLGIRLSGIAGFVLTFGAALVCTRYDERKVLGEPADAEEAA